MGTHIRGIMRNGITDGYLAMLAIVKPDNGPGPSKSFRVGGKVLDRPFGFSLIRIVGNGVRRVGINRKNGLREQDGLCKTKQDG